MCWNSCQRIFIKAAFDNQYPQQLAVMVMVVAVAAAAVPVPVLLKSASEGRLGDHVEGPKKQPKTSEKNCLFFGGSIAVYK